MTELKNINLDFSKVLKCPTCGMPIISYESMRGYGTCSKRCYQSQYYYNVTKNRRKEKLR